MLGQDISFECITIEIRIDDETIGKRVEVVFLKNLNS
jgi:hypothetical protein